MAQRHRCAIDLPQHGGTVAVPANGERQRRRHPDRQTRGPRSRYRAMQPGTTLGISCAAVLVGDHQMALDPRRHEPRSPATLSRCEHRHRSGRKGSSVADRRPPGARRRRAAPVPQPRSRPRARRAIWAPVRAHRSSWVAISGTQIAARSPSRTSSATPRMNVAGPVDGSRSSV